MLIILDICLVWNSHSNGYEDFLFIGCNTVYSDKSSLKYWLTFAVLHDIVSQKIELIKLDIILIIFLSSVFITFLRLPFLTLQMFPPC
jgi:hypothetical protein